MSTTTTSTPPTIKTTFYIIAAYTDTLDLLSGALDNDDDDDNDKRKQQHSTPSDDAVQFHGAVIGVEVLDMVTELVKPLDSELRAQLMHLPIKSVRQMSDQSVKDALQTLAAKFTTLLTCNLRHTYAITCGYRVCRFMTCAFICDGAAITNVNTAEQYTPSDFSQCVYIGVTRDTENGNTGMWVAPDAKAALRTFNEVFTADTGVYVDIVIEYELSSHTWNYLGYTQLISRARGLTFHKVPNTTPDDASAFEFNKDEWNWLCDGMREDELPHKDGDDSDNVQFVSLDDGDRDDDDNAKKKEESVVKTVVMPKKKQFL
jgi:hypothetical protein